MNLDDFSNYGFSELYMEDACFACMSIIGEIEGHDTLPSSIKSTSYEHLLPVLAGLEAQSKYKGLLILLHTSGGDVDAGLALAEMLAGMSLPKVSLTLGSSHSIGIPIALSADYSFISESGIMLAHPIRLSGATIGGEQSFEYINKLQGRIIKFVCSHSNISKNDFEKLIYNQKELTQDVGTLLVGKSCVSHGLINQIGGLSDALAKLKELVNINQE